MIHFILGGARSGKSKFAEQQTLLLAKQQNKQAIYIATATAIDEEMKSRIHQHQNDRTSKGNNWQLIECPLTLAGKLMNIEQNNSVYLLDCLTLWLNNQLFHLQDSSKLQQQRHLKNEIKLLITALNRLSVDIVIVSNEVGLGVIPLGESTRLYVDYCGWLNQQVAEISQQVTLVTAGIPLSIKSTSVPSSKME